MNTEKFLAPVRNKVYWIDAAAMLVFATLATISHDGLNVWHTFWPFWLGTYVAWFLFDVARRDAWTLESGVRVWIGTLAVGLIIWFLRHLRAPHWSFLVVASFMSILLIVGWRAVAALIRKARS